MLCFNGLAIEGGLAAVLKALLEWTKVSGQGRGVGVGVGPGMVLKALLEWTKALP